MKSLTRKRVRIKEGFAGAGKAFNVNRVRPTMSPKGKWNPSGYFVYFQVDKNTIVNLKFAHEIELIK